MNVFLGLHLLVTVPLDHQDAEVAADPDHLCDDVVAQEAALEALLDNFMHSYIVLCNIYWQNKQNLLKSFSL